MRNDGFKAYPVHCSALANSASYP